MNVATAPGSVDVAATEAPAFVGYAVSASEDKTVTVGESAEVKINVSNSDSIITTYNAYDLTLTYDTDKLTYNSCTAADALAVVKDDVPGTIRVIGFGDDKNLDTPAATLSFTAKGTGEAEVKITSAKVDIGSQAVGSDAPDAHILDTTTVISVTGYTVTLGEGLSGESTVAPGADYTFTAIDADNYDYVISATMGGKAVAVTEGANNAYTIANVTGNLVITIEKKSTLTMEVAVSEYVQMDNKTVFLVTVTGTPEEGKAFAYGDNVMYKTTAYGENVYSWLVIVDKNETFTVATAEANIAQASATAEEVKQSYDVNETGLVDINDAQLTYDIYSGKYTDFEKVSVRKFLRADVNLDKAVNSTDAVAVVKNSK